MTLSSTNIRASYVGDGSTTTFTYPYYFVLATDLVVMTVAANGTETVMTINSQYTVTGAGQQSGGTVTFTTAPIAGLTVVLYRDPPLTQTLHLQENDPLPAPTIEERLDLVTMQIQRLSDLVGRSFKLADGFTGTFSETMPAVLPALSVLRVNSGATGLDTVSPSDSTFAASLATLLGTGTNRQVLKFDSSAGSSIRWVNDRVFNVKEYPFGAKGDGSTNDTSSIAAAITAAEAVGGTVFFPVGTYKVDSTLTVTNACILQGEAMRYSIIKWTGGGSKVINVTSNADNVEIHNLTFENTGTATHAIFISCIRALITRVFTNPTAKFTTAVISTDPTVTTYRITLRNCEIFSSSNTAVNPIGFYGAQGHTMIVDDCMFSGCNTGVLCGGGSSATVQGFSIINSRFEQFSGVSSGYPGSSTDISIDVNYVQGLNITGCNFELAGDQDISSTGQRAIKLQKVEGGNISGNGITGNGVATALINIANSDAVGVKIEGNGFYRFGPGGGAAGYAVVATGSGNVWYNEIGHNFIWDTSASGSFNNTWTPVLTFGGGSTGLTYALQAGRAQRVGKFIIARGQVTLTAKGSSTGVATVTGLPITSDSNTQTGYFGNFENAVSVKFLNLTSIVGMIQGVVGTGTQTIIFDQTATGTAAQLTEGNFTNTTELVFCAIYEANF